jgi:hypothetical protein
MGRNRDSHFIDLAPFNVDKISAVTLGTTDESGKKVQAGDKIRLFLLIFRCVLHRGRYIKHV